MKKIVFTICLLLIFTNCHNKKSVSQKASDKDEQNHLQVENLQGNVKEFLLKQAYPLGDSQTEFQELKTSAYYIFNEAGNYNKMQFFNDFGKLDSHNVYRYNEAGLVAEFETKDFLENENTEIRELNTYNDENQLTHKKTFQNERVQYEVYMVYDTEKNIVESKIIHGTNVIFKTTENFLDDQDRVIKIIETSDKDNIKNIQSNVYDDSGNLIKHEANIGSLKFRNEFTYENGKRAEAKYYSIPLSGKVFLDRTTNYDANENITKVSNYENGVLKTVFNYEYEFDTQGNWIKKTTYINRNPELEEDFKLYLLETREITYW
ncbi:hypothetical protein [Kordia sp.]|uniref:hypothetical protein n=1 Tax=Kordia sp. TaxID=1965332 RepID=UPI0025B97212|nr:hypothetical protein [Kordia sp.]MCH2194327.1 hypothetical protein [Kordia sp.]